MTAHDLDKINMFFIVGSPRSGTTMLKDIFDVRADTVVPPESDFLKNEVGALTRLDNYGKVQIMENDETDFQENPVLTTALFSKDAVGSNFPEADVEFL